LIIIVLGYRLAWGWTGLPGKTLWDWLQLLVIPLALAGLAFLLNNSQSDREQRREDERASRQRATAADAAREEALRTYLTQMSGLMLDRKLLRSRRGDDVRAVARTLTLTTVRRLDGERKAAVVRFLVEARLLSARDPKVELEGANLRSADLQDVDPALSLGEPDDVELEGANLRSADLRGANLALLSLTDADLRGADLGGARCYLEETYEGCGGGPEFDGANLRGANLGGADLPLANFSDVDLRGANLPGADLTAADFAYADLRGANLRGAELGDRYTGSAQFSGAKYDATTRWPADFDPVAARAVKG
jgi:uncharacterized protein YjbI with pentapeptide repeats